MACRFRAKLFTCFILQNCNCSPELDPPSLAILQMSKQRLRETGALALVAQLVSTRAQRPSPDPPKPRAQKSAHQVCPPPDKLEHVDFLLQMSREITGGGRAARGRRGPYGPTKWALGRHWSQPISWTGCFLVVRPGNGDSLDSKSRGDAIPGALGLLGPLHPNPTAAPFRTACLQEHITQLAQTV